MLSTDSDSQPVHSSTRPTPTSPAVQMHMQTHVTVSWPSRLLTPWTDPTPAMGWVALVGICLVWAWLLMRLAPSVHRFCHVVWPLGSRKASAEEDAFVVMIPSLKE